MSKTDKELATELTIATIQMVTNHRQQNGAPSVNILDQNTTISILENFYSTLKKLDNQGSEN
ncbi:MULTISPECIES: hypothetical protein [Enterococcus]|uniref:Uncharacterized protein n=1 Tax=Enterococcus dongliensis TaxID=2559925 RepID=A0ABU3EL95_9ENTE|nr:MULTISPECIES: hypothetical protein [Enterococcus]MDT2429309.1 hypothetical protein [Enterococcus avium]MDT2595616.1 hypothetical protein [Enterococcus dongliensis]MDT2646427.1 hypothetical protein [Enterococcus dongliensis]MDT2670373.1 hypothetical protein [Enterococcus dongliensis]MDT2675030.1 hypothetical protein [Enterococcus dongliensis]